MIRRTFLTGAGLALAAGQAWGAVDPDTVPDPSPLAKAQAGTARAAKGDYRNDSVELELARAGTEGSELDYLVKMKPGDMLVYDWSVEGAGRSAEFYSDFHGVSAETPPAHEVSYLEGGALAAKGSLIAPFEGVHGWLFKNDSDRPLKVKLTIAGFYELRSLREEMGLTGQEYVPFGPPGWADRFGPAQKK